MNHIFQSNVRCTDLCIINHIKIASIVIYMIQHNIVCVLQLIWIVKPKVTHSRTILTVIYFVDHNILCLYVIRNVVVSSGPKWNQIKIYSPCDLDADWATWSRELSDNFFFFKRFDIAPDSQWTNVLFKLVGTKEVKAHYSFSVMISGIKWAFLPLSPHTCHTQAFQQMHDLSFLSVQKATRLCVSTIFFGCNINNFFFRS